ncbi:MAG: tripartite tricarboxylate transporter permease [Desulfarculaceae bacterium]|nr:tripartite tricarboxylate transporter permease [Desulfarculaceae bacterium]MCF8046292.1 tripartite tricarboxylate transporter permease [Desulfarculaceae bacterium]MCF8098733.1 tripartite tricarboxylate transporter permease [Desulfarculaceae bacterium]MCF8121640.1 tripartite tricarboxylate transporter permease [Desulfarculaceae bacterium]
MWDLLFNGFAEVLAPGNLIYLLGGVTVGIILGAIPGLTATMGIAMVIPLTLTLPPIPSLMMLMGAYKGGIFGGSIAAILLCAPGTSAAAATVADGHALAKAGKAIKALKISLTASVIGDTFSDIVLIFLAVNLARVALQFGPGEFTAVAIMALTIVGPASGKSLLKGLITAVGGLMLALIGLDPGTSLPRLTFDLNELVDGIALVPMLIGLLTIPEIMAQYEQRVKTVKAHIPPPTCKDDTRITRRDWKLMVRPMVSGSLMGTAIGIVPGLGPTLGAFMGYDAAWRQSKHREEFGRGSVEGIAGAESGNNSVSGANLVPLLGLGIPGDVEAAILVGAFLIHDLTPGPLIFQEAPNVVYGLYAGLLMANVLLYCIARGLLPTFTKAAGLRVTIIFPVMLVLCAVGSYAFNQSLFDVGVTFSFGLLGYALNKLNFPRATFLIGFILGPLLEDNFRRAMVISQGELHILFDSPLAIGLWIFTLISVSTILYSKWRQRQRVEALAPPQGQEAITEEEECSVSEENKGGYLRVSNFVLQLGGALVIFGFFLFCYLVVFPAQVETPGGFGVSALLFPNSLLFLGCLFSGLLALDHIRRRKDYGYSKMNYNAALRVCTYVAGMILYLLGLEYLGFMISSVVGILCFCILLGERKMAVVGPLAVLAPMAIYALFEFGLKVQLPAMPWVD